MSQITIRDLPETIEMEIRQLAARNRISLSKAVIELLHTALGTSPDQDKQRDVSCIFGAWSSGEYEEFSKNTRQFDEIDEEIWR